MNKLQDTKIRLYDIFFKERPAKILIEILRGNYYASEIARISGCTFSHVLALLRRFEDHGLVILKKEGRINQIELTIKGEVISKLFIDLIKKYDDISIGGTADEK